MSGTQACSHRLAPQSFFVAARAVKQRSGQDWRGAGNIGRWCGISTIDRQPPGWSLAAVRGH
jgi:hypothetical protein